MNLPDTDAGRKLLEEFEALLPHVISEKGFWPLPMMVSVGEEILKTQVMGLQTSDPKAYEAFLKYCQHPAVVAAIFGLDRYSDQDEMKTELNDVLTVVLYEASNRAIFENVSPRSRFRYGIIEYCFKPRVIRKINWNHRQWNSQMELELHAHVPDINYQRDHDGNIVPEILMPKLGSSIH